MDEELTTLAEILGLIHKPPPQPPPTLTPLHLGGAAGTIAAIIVCGADTLGLVPLPI